ncbi:TIGR03086 family metal-binding protein [Nonomuraea sp. NPDC050643]|uniref:TIGR03086 family metal-binding protein n=1 Tax=Nonomuraea sp. NPDC050643 TaxID=3155660 RepID=UPI0033F88951
MHDMMTQAAGRTAAVVAGVREEQFGLRTPCAEFDVKALINHLEWVADLFASLAAKGPMVEQREYAGDFPERVRRMLAAWEPEQAWEGESPGMGLPMRAVATMALFDLVVHGWDLARATGAPFQAEPETVKALLGFAAQMTPTGRQRGIFAEAVAVGPGATELDRLLAMAGRDPEWAPDRSA